MQEGIGLLVHVLFETSYLDHLLLHCLSNQCHDRVDSGELLKAL